MAETVHPLEVGDEVRHINQEWATSGIATAIVHAVSERHHDGTYEYTVLAPSDFSRRPSEDNPLREYKQWSSRTTLLVIHEP